MAIAGRAAAAPPERDPPRRDLPWNPQAVAAEANPASAPLAAFQEDDRHWFADHPGRCHRVRPFDPAEAPPGHPVPARPPGWRNFTIVRQVKPGHRIRVVFAAEGEPSTGEHAAARLFEICLRSLGDKPG
jgi:hypothetical protein